MRFLIAVLAFTITVTGAMAQSVVESVSASGNNIPSRGIFDPRSSIEVHLSTAEISRLLATSGNDANVSGDFRDLRTLSDQASAGLRWLPKVAAKDPAAINEISKIYNEVGKVLEKRGYQDRINDRLEREKSLDPLVLTKVYFEEANLLSGEISARLVGQLPILRVKLVLSRDPDQSRQPEQLFGVLPGDASKDALNQFLGSLSLSQNAAEITPKAVRDALVSQSKAKIQAEYGKLKDEVDGLFDRYSAKVMTIIADSEASQKDAWSKVRMGLDSASESWQKVRTEAAELLSTVPSNPSELEKYISKSSVLLADVRTLEARLSGLQAGVDAAIAGIKPALKTDGDALVALYAGAKLEVNLFLSDSLQSVNGLLNAGLEMLNLVDHLQKIGETYRDTAKGFVRFENSNQQLEGLPAMISYDELRVEMYTKPIPPEESKRIGDAFPIYAWKAGRLDNITALGFYPKHGSKKWAGTAILGQIYKFTLPQASFASNRMLPGIGYGVTALDLDDDGQTEMGVGGILTLWDDHIVVSYGYNLAGKGTYWCLGYRFRL